MESLLLPAQRKLSKKLKLLDKAVSKPRFRSFLVFCLGLLIFTLGAVQYYKIRILSFTETPFRSEIAEIGELPAAITIPSIQVDLPVSVGSIKNNVWQISYSGATFLDSSARPGAGGNTVIYGHNKKAIFGNLPYLSIGQKIYVKTADGKIHPYVATEKSFVGPDRVDLVSPKDKEELTIYTCWGPFDSQRVVIKAIPI